MKVKALARSRATTVRECSGDLRKQFRNLDPSYHPMQRAREYTRAVQGAKLERMFAKPFVGSLGRGHSDGVTASATCRTALVPFLSGAADGTVKLWDLTSQSQVAEYKNGHSRVVNGVTFGRNGQCFYSCADDGLIQCWSMELAQKKKSQQEQQQKQQSDSSSNENGPIETWRIDGSFKSIDHHWQKDEFVTATDSGVSIWNPERNEPIQSHENLWNSGADTVNVARYNPAEPNLVGVCVADRGLGILDTRIGSALHKAILRMRCNWLDWNPMEPMNFAVACEDTNSYLFDARKLDKPIRFFKGHTKAVLSISWSPTGQEFVTGSYDRTIRIYSNKASYSRDIYHTKRMQRVFTVNYTMDDRFIISGSDDTNIRIWKARASEQLGQRTQREERAVKYRQALVQKYQHLPEVNRISKLRRAPKVIKKQLAQTRLQKEKEDRKQSNRIKHSKPGTFRHESELQKTVLKKVE